MQDWTTRYAASPKRHTRAGPVHSGHTPRVSPPFHGVQPCGVPVALQDTVTLTFTLGMSSSFRCPAATLAERLRETAQWYRQAGWL